MSSSPFVMQPGSELEAAGKAADPFLTPLQQQKRTAYLRLQEDAQRRGWQPASLTSLHPFSWPVTGPVHQVDIRVPAVPLDRELWDAAPKLKLRSGLEVPYVQYVFAQWKPQQLKYVVGQLDFEEVSDSGHIWPLDQAEDAIKQNAIGADRGGVFCFEGVHKPGSNEKTRDREMALLEEAHRVQMIYYTDWYEKASDAFLGRQTTNSWKDLVGKGKYHRWMAMYLFRVGKIPALPSWYHEVASVGAKAQRKCGACGHNLEPTTVICSPKSCGWVADPYRAFNELLIDADTPGAKLVAKRLSTDEINALIENDRIPERQFVEWGFELGEALEENAEARRTAKRKRGTELKSS